MARLSLAVSAVFLLVALAGCQTLSFTSAPPHFGPTSVGNALVDSDGMTLYAYDKDPKNQSICTGTCADFWSPALASGGAKASGKLGFFLRPDNKYQWSYDGKPLYRYAGDTRPGDAAGDNLLTVWHAIKP